MKKKDVFIIVSCASGAFAIGYWQSDNVFGLLQYCFQAPAKDATIVIANDSDQTMKEVYSEFKKFYTEGYQEGAYPALDRLYLSRENWKFDKITWFNTSMKMQSYGAAKDLSDGKWEKFIQLLDSAISGYTEFVPYQQETSAIVYLRPCVNLSKRIALSKNITIPDNIKAQIINKLLHLEKLVKSAPTETTNNIKAQFLDDVSNIIIALQRTKQIQKNKETV